MSPYHPALSLAERQAEARKRLFAAADAVDEYTLKDSSRCLRLRVTVQLRLQEYKALYEHGWE